VWQPDYEPVTGMEVRLWTARAVRTVPAPAAQPRTAFRRFCVYMYMHSW